MHREGFQPDQVIKNLLLFRYRTPVCPHLLIHTTVRSTTVRISVLLCTYQDGKGQSGRSRGDDAGLVDLFRLLPYHLAVMRREVTDPGEHKCIVPELEGMGHWSIRSVDVVQGSRNGDASDDNAVRVCSGFFIAMGESTLNAGTDYLILLFVVSIVICEIMTVKAILYSDDTLPLAIRGK